MVVSCDTVWSHSRCPAATTCLTRSGWACGLRAHHAERGLHPVLLAAPRSTCGVQTGSGPSSMVMLTPRAPRSEACAMSTATGLTALSGGRRRGLRRGRPTAPACAVHTEAPAASNVTPSAAAEHPAVPAPPATVPCHVRPASRSSSPIPRSPCDQLTRRGTAATGCVRYRSRTIPVWFPDNWASSGRNRRAHRGSSPEPTDVPQLASGRRRRQQGGRYWTPLVAKWA